MEKLSGVIASAFALLFGRMLTLDEDRRADLLPHYAHVSEARAGAHHILPFDAANALIEQCLLLLLVAR